MLKKLLTILLISIMFCNCAEKGTKEKITDEKQMNSMKFDSLLNNYYEDGLILSPISATTSGDMRFNDKFPNTLTDAYQDSLKAYYKNYKEKVTAFNNADLSESEQMTKDILLWECNINLETLAFKNQKYFPIDQMWSVNLFMGQLASGASAQPFKTVADYENWIRRVDGFVEWMKTAETRMREGMKEGYVLPKSLIVKVIPQMEAMTDPDLKTNLFYSPAVNFPDSFSEDDKKQLTDEYTGMVNNKIIPTYKNMYDFMKNEYLPAGRETSGIADIPEGDNYYKHQIKLYTTTDMTAAQIHQLGLDEVARISLEMEKVKEKIGFKGDLKSFFDFVRTNKELMPYSTPEEVIAHFNDIYKRMQPQLEVLFDVKPKTPFEVRRTEAFRENSASAEYNPGSLDGTRPGIFYVPVPDAKTYNVYSDESLFLHEAIPGHHYQISLTQESTVLPQFRKTLWYSGYGEGWALYAESLGKELGLYTDPYQYFGMLGAEMHRAVRLVVDTGLHSKGWSREQAIQYSLDHEAESEAGVTSEIERYMANPGQALSYKIGQMKIRELREKAKEQMGDSFDIRKYHDQVLETGCIPLELLEKKINKWISESK
ncbi:MAG: DUF885 domain-containing protein [Leeuwenhoekiella sp.]